MKITMNQILTRVLMVVVLIMSVITAQYVSDRYKVGVPDQNKGCLEETVFLIDTNNIDIFSRGDYIAFKSKNMTPYFADNETIIKMIAGVPGDRVIISNDGVFVKYIENGLSKTVQYGTLDLLHKIGKPAENYFKDEIIPEGKFFTLGTLKGTYDSRYWGYMDFNNQKVIGKTYGIY